MCPFRGREGEGGHQQGQKGDEDGVYVKLIVNNTVSFDRLAWKHFANEVKKRVANADTR